VELLELVPDSVERLFVDVVGVEVDQGSLELAVWDSRRVDRHESSNEKGGKRGGGLVETGQRNRGPSLIDERGDHRGPADREKAGEDQVTKQLQSVVGNEADTDDEDRSVQQADDVAGLRQPQDPPGTLSSISPQAVSKAVPSPATNTSSTADPITAGIASDARRTRAASDGAANTSRR
jgi:hypothetical protein